MSAALENKWMASPHTSGQKLLRIGYTLIISEGTDFGRKIIEEKSRLELTQLQFQFLAEETPNGSDYFGFLFF
jgi:hypothetical protein